MSGFKKFFTVDDAISEFRKRVVELKEFEIINTLDSLQRIAFKNVYSEFDLPPEDRSVVDGYAVRSIDVSGASPSNPIQLDLIGKISAGEKLNSRLMKDQAAEIYTGGIMPEGADCVVMAEDCTLEDKKLIVKKQCFKYQNVSRRGEDFSKNDVVVKKGTLIRPFHIGAMISLGISEISVFRKARVSIISTGSELKNFNDAGDGIIDSTRPMLISLVKESNSEAIDLGIVKDDKSEIMKRLDYALKISDIVVITGGTSLGNYDLVPESIEGIANPGIIIHGIGMRPARTTGIAFHGNKPILMLSGFPVAAYISFNLFYREFIQSFYGAELPPVPKIHGRLTKRFPNPPGIRSFVRVRVSYENGEYIVEPLRLTGSGILSTLTKANGIMVVSENSEGYDENSIVEVELTQPIEEVKKDAKDFS